MPQKSRLVSLVRQLQTWGFRLMDCQQASPHVMRFGAEEIPRREFLDHLTQHSPCLNDWASGSSVCPDEAS